MKNAFEAGTQKIIPAVLLYAFKDSEILMIHARSKDGLPGKWNGLGGKLDFGESAVQAAVREFKEEANCETTPHQWEWLGQLHFPNFKAQKNEDWWVSVFITDLNAEQLAQIRLADETAEEGPLDFVQIKQILHLDLWDGDKRFLPYVFDRIPFQGTFYYESGHCARSQISAILHPKR